MEGGSTSAVLTYLCRILESLEQKDLVYSILQFLLASPSNFDSAPPPPSRPDHKLSLSRRKSIDALNALTEIAANPSPSLFNLRDLALLGLESSNEQTVLATLRLLVAVLLKHSSFADLLIRTMPGRPAKQRSVGAANAELGQLLSTAMMVVVDDPTLNDSYDDYLKDATWNVGSRLLPSEDYSGQGENALRPALKLKEGDPIMRELLHCLENFFTNSVIINLSLTEVLISIASSPSMSLDGWLLVDPSKYIYENSITEPHSELKSQQPKPVADILSQIRLAYRQPRWASNDTPVLAGVLQNLVGKVQQWRRDISDFDVLVAARRHLLREGSGPVPDVKKPQQQQQQHKSTESLSSLNDISSDYRGSPHRLSQQREWSSPESRTSRQRQGGLSTSSATSPDSRSTHSPSVTSPRAATAEDLTKRLATPFPVNQSAESIQSDGHENPVTEENENGNDNDNENENDVEVEDEQIPHGQVTLGHVLTNVVILYEFLLELTAVAQVRGNLLKEVGYPDLEASGEIVTEERREE